MSNLSTEMLESLLLPLFDAGYIQVTELADSIEFTEAGIQAILKLDRKLVKKTPVPVVSQNNTLTIIKLQQNWELGFINFIQEAKVPKYLDNGKGDSYVANNYSAPAMKIFRKAIEKEGILYDVLVKSTMLYYKSQRNRFKKAIGNYFIQGDWRSDYLALLEAAGTGTIEQHIKSEIEDGNKSHWKLG